MGINPSLRDEKPFPGKQGSPFEVVVDPEHGLVLLARVLDVHAAGEAQLVLRQPQLLQGLLGGNQPETLGGKREKSMEKPLL